LRRVEFTPELLLIEFKRPRDNLVSVTFGISTAEFAEALQVIQIIGGKAVSQ